MTVVTPPGPDTFVFEQPFHGVLPLLNDTTPTFLGVPAARSAADLRGAGAAIVGVPYSIPEFPYGADLVPRHLRVAAAKFRGGYLPELELDPLGALGVVDYGDVDVDPADPTGSLERTRRKVADVIEAGAIPITIGGAAPLSSYAPLKAVCQATEGVVGVVNLDEHGDNADVPPEVEAGALSWVSAAVRLPNVQPEHWAQIGMRGPGTTRVRHRWFVEKGFHLVTGRQQRELGTRRMVDEALARVGDGAAALWLGVDWDVLDTSAAPGWSYPDPLGLSADDVLHLCYEVGRAEPPLAGCALMALPAWSRPPLWLATWAVLYLLAGVCARRGLAG